MLVSFLFSRSGRVGFCEASYDRIEIKVVRARVRFDVKSKAPCKIGRSIAGVRGVVIS